MATRGFNAQDLLHNIPNQGAPTIGFSMAAATAQAADWPADCQAVRLGALTTAGAEAGFYFNDGSTQAAVGAATSLTTGSTSLNTPGFGPDNIFRKVPGSTGFSLIAPSSCIITAEFFSAR